jgi:uncharacterized SAM-binding protein YcdF (DUF218 family)
MKWKIYWANLNPVQGSEQSKMGLKSIIKALLAVGLVSFLIIEGLILHAAYLAEKHATDYVVVLGAGLWGDQLSPTLRYRLDKCLEYLREHPEAKVVVSGGQGPDEYISEAEAMQRYLVANSIEEHRVVLEDKSTSTYENLLFSKQILEQIAAGEDEILIITSDFHMFRAKLLASRMGIVAYGMCAESVNYLKPYYYFREYFVVLKSLILDK